MEAFFRALKHWQVQFRGQSVLLATDNSTVMAYINKQGDGTRSQSLAWLSLDMLEWCHAQGIYIVVRHFPGLLFVLAVGLSHKGQIQPTECSLSPLVFRLLSRLWGSPQMDLFDTQWNTKLPVIRVSVSGPFSVVCRHTVVQLGRAVRVRVFRPPRCSTGCRCRSMSTSASWFWRLLVLFLFFMFSSLGFRTC